MAGMWRLRLALGRGAGTDFAIPIGEDRTFGRSASADHMFSDHAMADVHARVHGELDGILVTSVDGEASAKHNGVPITTARLADGDRLTIGETVFTAGPLVRGAGSGDRESIGAVVLPFKALLYAKMKGRSVGSFAFTHRRERAEIFFRRGGIVAVHLEGRPIDEPASFVRGLPAFVPGVEHRLECIDSRAEILTVEVVFEGVAPPLLSGGLDANAWSLRVVTGVQRGRELVLAPPRTAVVGADAESDLVLDDNTVSGRHVRLVGKDGLEVTDLGSKNGTFINGELVAVGTLKHGDRLTLGHCVLVVTRRDRPPPSLVRPEQATPQPGRRRYDVQAFDLPGSLLVHPLVELLLLFDDTCWTGTLAVFGVEGGGTISFHFGDIVGVLRDDVVPEAPAVAIREMLAWTGSYMMDDKTPSARLATPLRVFEVLEWNPETRPGVGVLGHDAPIAAPRM